MLRKRRMAENEVKRWKAIAQMHKAEAQELKIDISFAQERADELADELKRTKAKLKGAEAMFGAAMKRIAELEKQNASPSVPPTPFQGEDKEERSAWHEWIKKRFTEDIK